MCSKHEQHNQWPLSSKRLKHPSTGSLLQHVVFVEVVLVVAEALARRLVFTKITIMLKLVFKLKSLKLFSKLVEIKAPWRLSELFCSLWRHRIYVKVAACYAIPVFKVTCGLLDPRSNNTFKPSKVVKPLVKFKQATHFT